MSLKLCEGNCPVPAMMWIHPLFLLFVPAAPSPLVWAWGWRQQEEGFQSLLQCLLFFKFSSLEVTAEIPDDCAHSQMQLTPALAQIDKVGELTQNCQIDTWFTGCWGGSASAERLQKSLLEPGRIYCTSYASLNHPDGHFCRRSTFKPNQYGKLLRNK